MKTHYSSISFTTFVFTAFIVLLITSSCKCPGCEKQEEAGIPLEVLEKSNEFIISKTGEDFFDKNITADFFRTKHTPPYYEMVYKLFMPDKPYVNALIKFTVDSIGNVMENRDIVGIPKCRYFPEECNFNIDETAARSIASEGGLEEGIKNWEVGFLWNFERERYVWHILSTFEEMEGEFGYRGSGKEMIIDPVNGEILAINDWRVN